MPAVPTALSAEEQRYEQRFGCLETLGRPEAVPFEHFQGATDAGGMPPPRVLGVAHANFQRAAERAAALLQTPQLRGLLRVEQVGGWLAGWLGGMLHCCCLRCVPATTHT